MERFTGRGRSVYDSIFRGSKILCASKKGGDYMIPETLNSDNLIDIDEFESPPSLTYRLDFTNRRIIGKVDDKEAVMQFIKKVLDTSKYAYTSYDWYYGNQLNLLVGQSYDYVVARVPKIIEEALCCDDRVTGVRDFKFTRTGLDSCTVSFYADTIYGSQKVETGVQLGLETSGN